MKFANRKQRLINPNYTNVHNGAKATNLTAMPRHFKGAYQSIPQTCFSAMTNRRNFANRSLGFNRYENNYRDRNNDLLPTFNFFSTMCSSRKHYKDGHYEHPYPINGALPSNCPSLINTMDCSTSVYPQSDLMKASQYLRDQLLRSTDRCILSILRKARSRPYTGPNIDC
ncbi:hypothetical protein GJ496_007415 [Pomphorhynchus laevis]|nr:hypothetical protein GJ496_007415 [Pomphorhynchus laevis]